MAMENHHFLVEDTSSNGCFYIVMLVFGDVYFNLRLEVECIPVPNPGQKRKQAIICR